jgi:N-methylhydantoinase B
VSETIKGKDVFTFEVIRSLLDSIPREMAEVIKRTSYHPIFNEVLDFSTALLNGKGELSAQYVGVQVHLGALELCVKTIIDHFGKDGFKQGDIVIHNNPFPGGSHLPDVDIMAPVFYEGKLISFAIARGHHGDIGGTHAGSFAGDSTSIFQEGIRIPPIKLYEAGKLNEGARDLLLANVHIPIYTWGDLQAQIASCHVGEKRIIEMYDKYGMDVIEQAIDWSFDRSEQLMRGEIKKWPDATYVFTDYLDNDGIDKEKEIKIHVKITIAGDEVTFDFSGSDQQVKGPANCVLGNLTSGVYTALFNLTDRTIAKNHGCYRPVTIIAPEGLVVNAKFPAPVVSGNTETNLRIIDTIIGAFAKAMPEAVIGACQGTTSNVIWGGIDPRSEEPYALYLGGFGGGGGARATKDGWGPQSGAQIGGANGQIPIEELETKFPFIVEEASIVPDSGGPGRFRGGQAEFWKMHTVQHTCEIGGCQDRSVIPPYGLFGGMPGLHGDNRVERKDGEIVDINRSGGVPVAPDDLIYLRFPGGGGYGDPLERDLDYLQHDVTNEIVSLESARNDYGAVVDESTMKIDREATEVRRKQLKREWQREGIFIDQKTKPYARREFRVIRMDEQI